MAAIGLKANVSEAEHPLLCEGTRRQRGDLALMLLMYYKDVPDRVARIMNKLLDSDIHPHFKSPLLPFSYTCATSAASVATTGGGHSAASVPAVGGAVARRQPNAAPPQHQPQQEVARRPNEGG